MARHFTHRVVALAFTISLFSVTTVQAQSPPDSAATDTTLAAQSTPPPSPVRGIRGKLSAADLLSAESILEAFRGKHGDGGAYANGLGWLARGALLVGDSEKAWRYSSEVRALHAKRVADGVALAEDRDLEIALGAVIEVEAQLLAAEQGKDAAARHLQAALDEFDGPVAFRSRIYKRMNLLSMIGTRAPELVIEGFVGDGPPLLETLRGKPVVMFLWNARCGDCKAQAPALARLEKQYGERGLQIVTLTRYYREEAERSTEKAYVDSVWSDVYADINAAPAVLSTDSMIRYGGSSTPTYVFVDRDGIVRDYEPYRLTDVEFDRRVSIILDESGD